VAAWLDDAVRIAGEGRRSPVIIVTPVADALDDVALMALRRGPADVAAFGHAVAAVLRGEVSADPEVTAAARALDGAGAPLVIAGAGLGIAGPVEAAAEIVAALGARARIALFPPDVNPLGLALLGGAGLDSAVAAVAGRPLIVVEADLYARADGAVVDRLLGAASTVIALDCLATATVARADAVIPVASFAEATGTVVNHEGRAQRSLAARPPRAPAAWRVLSDIGGGLFGGGAEVLDDVLDALAAEVPGRRWRMAGG
jgi:NADH-quinone oxidoreductase subunit G